MEFNTLQNLSIYELQKLLREDFSNFSTFELDTFRQSNKVFSHSKYFTNSREGYVFTVGSSGIGYYLDLPLPDYTGKGLYFFCNS
jgi:hypothetical protein